MLKLLFSFVLLFHGFAWASDTDEPTKDEKNLALLQTAQQALSLSWRLKSPGTFPPTWKEKEYEFCAENLGWGVLQNIEDDPIMRSRLQKEQRNFYSSCFCQLISCGCFMDCNNYTTCCNIYPNDHMDIHMNIDEAIKKIINRARNKGVDEN